MNNQQIKSYKDLIVWRKSMDLVVLVYRATDVFPKSELYGLTMQMRRAAISIPSNIAEGFRRGTRKDYRHFLTLAYGSGAELETQIEASLRLTFLAIDTGLAMTNLLDEIMKMLNTMTQKLDDPATPYSLPARQRPEPQALAGGPPTP